MNLFKNIGDRNSYWIILILLGLSMEAVGLYYQYVLDEWPCVLCIHIRIWILGFIMVAFLALLLKRFKPIIPALHILNSLMMIGFVERSWQTLAVERGWIFGNCNMDAGLPSWFQLDQWFPLVFEVKAACGYTPFMLFNISMAEILMVLSALLLGLSLACSLASFQPSRQP
ncbi:MAG: disulfide bond formation protein DsbB [Candidatus Azotimanducaceae bacterium]|jgi:disulfide bond formation protein DsbB